MSLYTIWVYEFFLICAQNSAKFKTENSKIELIILPTNKWLKTGKQISLRVLSTILFQTVTAYLLLNHIWNREILHPELINFAIQPSL